MRILLYTQYFPPETNAPANRWDYFAKYLKEKGHEITVLTSYPNHPLGKIFDGYKNRWCSKESQDDLEIIRNWTYISSSRKFIPRFLNYSSFAFSSFINSLFLKKYDLIIASLPPLSVGFIGQKIAKKQKKPLVLDVRDLWPEAAEETGYLKKGWLYFYFLKKAAKLYHQTNTILVNSLAILEELVCSYGVPKAKIEYLPNGADLKFFQTDVDTSVIDKKYNIQKKFVVLYTGLLGYAQAPEIMIEAADVLRDKKDIVFLIVGTGPLEKELKIEARKLKLTNVIFTGLRPHEEMPQFVTLADICLIPYKNKETFKDNIPSKMFDYLASGTPIIINLEGEASSILLKSQTGILVKPENPQSLADGILKLYADKSLRGKMGALAKTYAANNFDKREISQKLEIILKTLLP